jgi:hypothetical protein
MVKARGNAFSGMRAAVHVPAAKCGAVRSALPKAWRAACKRAARLQQAARVCCAYVKGAALLA